MIITFCGHHEIYGQDDLEDKVFRAIEKRANNKPVNFYLGGYGKFDSIALNAARRYKQKQPRSILYFVTPYIENAYLKNKAPFESGYDEIIYPEIEKTPKKFAINERNKFMIRQSDFVISYVCHSWGGAAKTLNYAIKQKKSYVNLYEKE